MTNKSYTFIANWKMYLSAQESVSFAAQHKDALVSLTERTGHKLVICPSMVELWQVGEIFNNTSVAVGAQDCADAIIGAYTGQTSVASIKQAGARVCLVGHSERRLYCGETDASVAKKVSLLLDNQMTPVVCIGENLEASKAGTRNAVLEQQLNSVLDILEGRNDKPTVIIAYEPMWAIGTGDVPTQQDLVATFAWLYTKISRISGVNWQLLYGGSVTENTISIFKNIPHLDGFLIGRASLHVQVLEKIVSSF